MQGLASVFIALSLLLSPLTTDRNGANSSASGDGPMSLGQQAEHSESGYLANGPVVSSIEGGGTSAMTTEDKDNSDCPIKYPDPNSKAYCECVVDRTDNFVCNYDCSCSLGGILCSSSSCNLSVGAILLIVGAVVVVVGTCAGCVAFCVVRSRNRRDNYTLVSSSP